MKRRLYRLCRTLLTHNWPKYLTATVKAINETPNSAIGYLKPNDIRSSTDDPKIDQAIGFPTETSFEKQMENQKAYEKNTKLLQVGDHVYLDFPPSTMEKGFDTPVSHVKLDKKNCALIPSIGGRGVGHLGGGSGKF